MRTTPATNCTFALLFSLGTATALAGQQPDTRPVLNTVFPENTERELALSAAPEHLRAGATVYVYGTNGFTRVQTGTNGFTCLVNRDSFLYGSSAFKPTCWDAEGATSYVPVMLRVAELLAIGRSADEIRADIDSGFKDGRFHRPRRTGVAYMLAGDVNLDLSTGTIVNQAFPGHYMIYAPGVTSADLGYSPEAARGNASLPFIFRSGAGGAELGYLIIVPHGAGPMSRPAAQGTAAIPATPFRGTLSRDDRVIPIQIRWNDTSESLHSDGDPIGLTTRRLARCVAIFGKEFRSQLTTRELTLMQILPASDVGWGGQSARGSVCCARIG